MQSASRLSQSERSSQIIEAAIQVFAIKGFNGAKTKEIAEAAGINEALIFRDFQTKDKLYCAILQYAYQSVNTAAWIDELRLLEEDRDDEALFTALALRVIRTLTGNPVLYRLMLYCALEQHELAVKFRERQIEPLERFIEEYISRRRSEGAFSDVDAHMAARNFLSMCYQHVLRRVLFGEVIEPATEELAASTFTRIFLNGVCTHE